MRDSISSVEPLIVLCNHRSGSSLFTSLLADAGLHLGELLPPAADNPRGFFENRAVVEINRQLFDERDRDWTCPPPSIDHRLVDLDPLKEVGAQLAGQGGPWGFKDPRTLFTLPVWSAALGPCRLVGVHRNSADVARSLSARDDLSFEQALAIALAHAERLAEAHKRLNFPIVSFDAERSEFIDRVAAVASALGLELDSADALSRYEEHLVHHRPGGDDDGPSDRYLEEAAQQAISELVLRTPHTIVETWERLPSSLAADLPRHLGPRFDRQRTDLLRESVRLLPDVAELAVIEPEERTVLVRNSPIRTMTPSQFLATAQPADRDAGGVSHLVAPSLLDEVPPGELGTTLDLLKEWFDAPAVCAVGGWLLDAEDVPSSHVFEPAGVKASRTVPPFLHHLDEITPALKARRLLVAGIERTSAGRTFIFLTNDHALQNDSISGSKLRVALSQTEQALQRREDELAMARGELASIRTNHGQATQKLLATERLNADLNSQLSDANNRLRKQVATAEAEQDNTKRALAETQKRLKSAEQALTSVRRSYERLSRRRTVKAALAMARPMRPVFRVVRSLRKPGGLLQISRTRVAESIRRKPRRSRKAIEQAIRSRDSRTPETGPMVSILILTRDGAHHLERLLPALEAITYRSFETVIVDNGSTDRTSDVLARNWSFPIRVLRNDHNSSFSAGNNQAAEVATGELLLFLNNDIEPVAPGWLGELVVALEGHDERVAAGALLVYPDLGDPATAFTVQHAGIRFGERDGAPYARNIAEPDPLALELQRTWEVAASSAAALLVRRNAFERIGGFDEGYVYGAEDVDLCLKLIRHGTIVVAGKAVLFHYESASQRSVKSALTRVNRIGNWQLFAERWGPTFARSQARGRLAGDPRWSEAGRRRVSITVTRNDQAAGFGDYYTAHELGDAFATEGWDVVYIERHQDHWYDVDDSVDLVISLLDAYDVRRSPKGAFTIAWVRSWVDRWIDQPWFDSFDLVVTSSEKAADAIADRTRFNPTVIPLATNPQWFSPGATNPTFAADYAFTGNYWGVGRGLIGLLDVRPNERFLAFGKGWDSEPRITRYWRGHIDYEHLPQLYRSVKVVLDDTATHTLPHAFVNSRVFDALASGALVLTNNVEGSKELFDGMLPTYTTRAELRSQLDLYLSDEELRKKTVDTLRSRVLESFTYDRLPGRFFNAAISAIDMPRIAFKIGVPRTELLEYWGDTHFANAIAASLSRIGFQTETHILPEWDRVDRQHCDVVVHLRGLSTYTPKSAHVNVLWVISHPDDLSPGECDKYDLVLVASRPFAEELAQRTDVPVVFMPQATDWRRFHPQEPDPDIAEDLLFVGNSRRQHRHGVDWAVERHLPLAVYGREWDGMLPSHYLKGEYVHNDRLSPLYASAKIVLNDHWPDMRERGFVSNRIFDVLAAGGVVISDTVDGLSDLVGDLVPTYDNAEELDQLVRDLLDDAGARDAIRARGPGLVASEHTFEHRAHQLAELLWPLLDGRPKDVEGETFSSKAR